MYEDIDRAGGSSWTQILTISLNLINGINERITNYISPQPAATSFSNKITEPGLPRLTGGLKEGNILSAPLPPKSASESIMHTVGSIAKQHGQSPSPVARGRRFIEKAKSSVLTPEQEKSISADGIWATIRQYALVFLSIPLGAPFRQDFRRRINTVVLGSPHGDVGILVDAANALTRLAVCSLQEDSYGNVQKDIPTIIRTFTITIERLENFKKNLGFHWTDVERNRQSPEIDAVLIALKSALQELIAGFGDYAADLRLSQSDMRLARHAAALKELEMKQSNR